jgi:hypothetical protein
MEERNAFLLFRFSRSALSLSQPIRMLAREFLRSLCRHATSASSARAFSTSSRRANVVGELEERGMLSELTRCAEAFLLLQKDADDPSRTAGRPERTLRSRRRSTWASTLPPAPSMSAICSPSSVYCISGCTDTTQWLLCVPSSNLWSKGANLTSNRLEERRERLETPPEGRQNATPFRQKRSR